MEIYFLYLNLLDFFSQVTNQELAHDNIENVLKEIKRRVKARLELCAEIHQLESGNLPIFTGTVDPIPQKIATTLYKFVTLSWKNYCNNPDTPSFCHEGLVTSTDVFYEAVLRRGSSKFTLFFFYI